MYRSAGCLRQSNAMRTGKVARWVASRGFGFIVGDNGGPDVFCHLSALPHGLDRLAVGTRVNFDIVKDREGRPRAANVQLVDSTES